jgi:thiosulfate reductase/polysulfide reductase chain A
VRENEVWVNTATAQRAGLVHGQYVQLKNQDGAVSNRVKVKATQRLRPDCVYMVYGFGHTAKAQTTAYLKGASATQLTTRYVVDPLMGGTSLHSNFVTFVSDIPPKLATLASPQGAGLPWGGPAEGKEA